MHLVIYKQGSQYRPSLKKKYTRCCIQFQGRVSYPWREVYSPRTFFCLPLPYKGIFLLHSTLPHFGGISIGIFLRRGKWTGFFFFFFRSGTPNSFSLPSYVMEQIWVLGCKSSFLRIPKALLNSFHSWYCCWEVSAMFNSSCEIKTLRTEWWDLPPPTGN